MNKHEEFGRAIVKKWVDYAEETPDIELWYPRKKLLTSPGFESETTQVIKLIDKIPLLALKNKRLGFVCYSRCTHLLEILLKGKISV